MDFDNQSGLAAKLLRADLPQPDMTLAVVVAKACGVFNGLGHMRLEPELEVPFQTTNAPHPYGHIPSDLAIRKDGMDVLALGRAYHPELAGGGESRVSLSVGDETRQLRIFGERTWYRTHAGHWAISEPIPFSLLDLTWSNSFGGRSFDDFGNDVQHALNPEGKGVIGCEDAIEHTSLPNIEDPAELVCAWTDQPRPFNIAPAPKAIAIDHEQAMPATAQLKREPYRVPAELWNDAVARFRFHDVERGSLLTLAGMSEQPLHAIVPALALTARVHLGPTSSSVPLQLDTVLFLPESKRCTFTWRGAFTYRFEPRQLRSVVLQRSQGLVQFDH